MDERIERRPSWAPWAIASLVMVIVAMLAYGAGQHEGASAGTTAAEHWHWGGSIWGILIFFWVFGIFRGMFFGWGWGCGPRPWRYRRYYRYDRGPGNYDDYDEWREWHRREHQRTDDRGAGTPQTPPGTREA